MTDDVAYRTVYLLLHDEEFLRAHKNLEPVVFPPGPMKFLADLALRQWAKYRNTVTSSVLNQALEVECTQLRKMRATEEAVIRLYLDLDSYAPDESALPYIREVCTAWLEQYSMGAYVEQAGAALDRGDVEKAREKLSTALSSTVDTEENVRLSAFIGQPPHGFSGGAIPTGLYDLDKLWEGGIHPGELGIILGPTGTGKSMMAVALAVEAFWKSRSCLYYTFELTPNQILRRAVTGILQKGARSLKWGRNEPLNATLWQTELLRASKGRHMNAPPTADIDVRTGLMTIRDLIHDIDQYIAETGGPPGLVVLDSADELVPERQRKAGWEELREIFSTLRGEVAQGREVPIWTTGQATREAVDKARISLKHVGASFAKAQKAHFVLGLAQTDQERDDVEGPWMNVFVLKDTHHGCTGGWLRCVASFGRGDNGFPALEVQTTHGLPVLVGGEEP